MKNYFNYESFFSNFQISKITKESKISLKCHYLKYFIYFSLNKIFLFGLFLMTKLSIIMIYCSKVVVLFFGFWILPIIRDLWFRLGNQNYWEQFLAAFHLRADGAVSYSVSTSGPILIHSESINRLWWLSTILLIFVLQSSIYLFLQFLISRKNIFVSNNG